MLSRSLRSLWRQKWPNPMRGQRHYVAPTRPEPGGQSTRLKLPSYIYRQTSTAILTCLVIHLCSTYLIEVSACHGPSMVPTLSATGDWLVINKRCNRGKGIRVGDVIDYMHPLKPGCAVVKRVMGMPGDFVVADTMSFKHETDAGTGPSNSDRREHSMLQVPEGHCWVEGDNLPESRDSRMYGPVPLALVTGKVIARLLPLGEAKWITNGLEPV